jgi:hypothetical protein
VQPATAAFVWRKTPGTQPAEWCLFEIQKHFELWQFVTCKDKTPVTAERYVGSVEVAKNVCTDDMGILWAYQEAYNAAGAAKFFVNPPPTDGAPPPAPPPPADDPDHGFNCIGNAVGGGTGGILTNPPSNKPGLFPANSNWHFGTSEGWLILSDECWTEVESCTIDGGAGDPPPPVPDGQVVAFRSGKLKADGSKGEPDQVRHATVSNGNGTFNDKDGTHPHTPAKTAAEVKAEQLADKGFTDPDGDGVYTNGEGEWADMVPTWPAITTTKTASRGPTRSP